MSEFVRALVAIPAYAGKEAELKKKNVGDLKKLWEEIQPKPGGAPTASEASTVFDENATDSDEAES